MTPRRPSFERGGAVSARHMDVRTGARRARGWFVGEPPSFRGRAFWLWLAFVSVGIILAGRLVDVQIRQGKQLASAAAQMHQISVALSAHRGRIFDANGNILASDVAVYDIYADPSLISSSDRAGVAAQLAPVLNMGPGLISDLLGKATHFVYLSKGVSADVRSRLEALRIDGVGAIERDKRVYEPSPITPNTFAEPLLGYVDGEGNGSYGVEQYYNKALKGVDGSESTLRDMAGNSIVLSQQTHKDARDGSDLHLGLDSRIQYWAEQALAKGVAYAEAESGEVLVMDTKSGVVRAWAQDPAYNANDFAHANVADFRDQSIADLYEPGSTMKVITFAGGLNGQVIAPTTTLDEQPQTIDGYTIHDWDNKAHGLITMQDVLDQSLNNGAIRVMQLLGHDAFYKNLLAFGVGSPTGIDLAGEQNQPLEPQSQWSDIDYATASFGQHVSMTPVEMLAAINAVGNGGVWVQPHVVQAVVDPATGKSTPVVATTRRVMTPESANTLATMMTGVVDHKNAEGFLARIPGFQGQIAGKTGTADEPTNGQYEGSLIVSFGAFMPVSNPQFTMLVVLRYPHETKVPRFGAFLAAPVWKDIAQVIVDQWRILP